MRVLVVDDCPDTCRILSDLLREAGHRPAAFCDAEGALAAHRAQPFPILLVDWELSGMSGVDLCRAVRTLPDGELPVVILVTAHTTKRHMVVGLEAGADDYVPKPIGEGALRVRLAIAERTAHERARRRQAEAELREREVQVRELQRMDALGRLAGGVAHDFNNMLTAIQGYAELAVMALDAAHPLQGDVQEIINAAERAAGLTQQLLAFSRRQIGEPKRVRLSDCVAGIEGMLRRLIGEHIQLETRPTSDAHVYADPRQIGQIILNLALNARDAMADGGSLRIDTSDAFVDRARRRRHPGVAPGHYAVLSVHDTGHGMDERTRSQVFEPFFTTREQGQGTGLGLSIVYGIVGQYGGHIVVDTVPLCGTTMRVYLPIATASPAEPPPVEKAESPRKPGGQTVLLVEDEKSVRRLAARVLRTAGYKVVEAADGMEALAMAADGLTGIDLLLTDVVMPNLDGLSLAETLRLERSTLKILFMSGYSATNIADLVANEPAMGFVQKPFSPRTLRAKVRQMLHAA